MLIDEMEKLLNGKAQQKLVTAHDEAIDVIKNIEKTKEEIAMLSLKLIRYFSPSRLVKTGVTVSKQYSEENLTLNRQGLATMMGYSSKSSEMRSNNFVDLFLEPKDNDIRNETMKEIVEKVPKLLVNRKGKLLKQMFKQLISLNEQVAKITPSGEVAININKETGLLVRKRLGDENYGTRTLVIKRAKAKRISVCKRNAYSDELDVNFGVLETSEEGEHSIRFDNLMSDVENLPLLMTLGEDLTLLMKRYKYDMSKVDKTYTKWLANYQEIFKPYLTLKMV